MSAGAPGARRRRGNARVTGGGGGGAGGGGGGEVQATKENGRRMNVSRVVVVKRR